jgi:endogenous inhibitor of DNA gyrase (YacG/DUF329 family)
VVIVKHCLTCGKEFSVSNCLDKMGYGKYCSRSCFYDGLIKPEITRTCKHCGKGFTTTERRLKSGRGIYCSHECQYLARTHMVTRVCSYCGKTFLAHASEVKRDHAKFCSAKCASKDKQNRTLKTCRVCGKPFEVLNSKLERHSHCSKRCALVGRSETVKASGAYAKSNNPAWRGGTSYGPYCSKFNEEIKERVRDEFGRTCFLCPTTETENGQKLCVHHVDYNKSQGCKGLKWGLIPLCRKCHAKTNHKMWYWFALLRDYWIYKCTGINLYVSYQTCI